MERTPSEGVSAKPLVTMKLSAEATVAATVAMLFAVFTLGAIAREGAPGSTATKMPALTQVAALGFDTPSSGPRGATGESQLLAQH